MTKKIGIILNSTPYFGGTFQYNQTILDALKRIEETHKNIKIVVAFDNPLWYKCLARYNFEIMHVDLDYSAFMNIKIPVCFLRKIISEVHPGVQQLLEKKSDLWICPSQDAWSFLLEAPVLSTIHDLMHRYERRFPEVSDNGEFEWREYLYKNICKYSKSILVDSLCGQDQVKESYKIRQDKIKILPYIPPQYILSEKMYDIREIYNIRGEYIFYPAQFWKHKNHINLLKAMAILKKTIVDIKLVLCGSVHNGYTEVLNEINTLGLQDNVQILHYIASEHMPDMYRNSKGLVMPTYFGPTNIPPLEAMVLGCPMAISNIYGMPEQIGDAALYFDPNDIEEMAQVILKLWEENQTKEVLKKACVKNKSEYSIEKFMDKLYEIILEML